MVGPASRGILEPCAKVCAKVTAICLHRAAPSLQLLYTYSTASILYQTRVPAATPPLEMQPTSSAPGDDSSSAASAQSSDAGDIDIATSQSGAQRDGALINDLDSVVFPTGEPGARQLDGAGPRPSQSRGVRPPAGLPPLPQEPEPEMSPLKVPRALFCPLSRAAAASNFRCCSHYQGCTNLHAIS